MAYSLKLAAVFHVCSAAADRFTIARPEVSDIIADCRFTISDEFKRKSPNGTVGASSIYKQQSIASTLSC
jgi:hypothetical protein